MKQVTPFLMFEGKAEEAMTFYCETIPDSSVLDATRYGSGETARKEPSSWRACP